MKVIGIDPGFNITGYCVLENLGEKPKLIEAGEIRSKASDSVEKRLKEIFTGVDDIIKEFHPDSLAVEEIYSHYNHPKTAVIMGHARGVIILAAGIADIPVYSYPATRIKRSLTGSGHASKEQISRMVLNLLDCAQISFRPDVTDAVAVALCHINVVLHGGTL